MSELHLAEEVARGLTEGQRAIVASIEWRRWEPPPGKPPILMVEASPDEWSGQPLVYMEDLRDFPPTVFQREGDVWHFLPLGLAVKRIVDAQNNA